MLMIRVLAELASYESSHTMVHWAKLHTRELNQLFALKRERQQPGEPLF